MLVKGAPGVLRNLVGKYFWLRLIQIIPGTGMFGVSNIYMLLREYLLESVHLAWLKVNTWDKTAAIFHMTFSNAFSWMKFDYDFIVPVYGSNWQYSSIGSNNGLAPDRQQANVWTNND